MSRVFVAMSGGVDSSVAAALLARDGHDVTGVTMTLLPEGADTGADAVLAARRVCETLGVPHHSLDARDAFHASVVEPFARGYASGETPNPCVECNDRVKFGWLLERALEQGADALATGHYARIADTGRGLAVARGADRTKDQSYFLYRLDAERLARVLFPLGEMRKPDVRALAVGLGLPCAETPESQETCFAPRAGYAGLVAEAHPEALAPGPFVTEEGVEIGRHEGIARYTVGQRQGLGLPGGPWFVLRIDAAANTVVVGSRDGLAVTRLTLRDVVWHGAAGPARCSVTVRYRMRPVPATVAGTGVTLDEPIDGAAPGQAAVAYDGDVVLGGGPIATAE